MRIKICNAFGRDNSNGGCAHNIAGLCSSKCEATKYDDITEETPTWMLEFTECMVEVENE